MNFLQKIAASSLVLLLHCTALAVDWAGLDKELSTATEEGVRFDIAKKYGAFNDPEFKKLWDADHATGSYGVNNYEGYVRSKVIFGDGTTAAGESSVSGLKEITEAKKDPIYHDQGGLTESSWMADSAKKMQDWFDSLDFRVETPAGAAPNFPSISPDFIEAAIYIALAACALMLIKVFAPFFKRNIKVAKSRSGLITEEEAGLSIDEWLARADEFIADGRHREAVRCLYIACLIRLDESKKLDLKSFETNWEHYRRFTRNKFSQQFDLKTPTEGFDQFWYGNKDCTESDALQFRSYYESVTETLKVASK